MVFAMRFQSSDMEAKKKPFSIEVVLKTDILVSCDISSSSTPRRHIRSCIILQELINFQPILIAFKYCTLRLKRSRAVRLLKMSAGSRSTLYSPIFEN